METIMIQVKGVLQNVLKLGNLDNLTPETRLFEDLSLDSTSSFELLIALEDVVPGLVINPDTLEQHHFQTLGNLVQYVTENTQSPQ